MITKDLKILDDFCKGCGTCEGVCPHKAIRLKYIEESGRYLPRLEKTFCHGCDICYKSCPAWPFDPDSISFKSLKSASANHLMGFFLNTYSGFANDGHIRISSSSGGIATALLINKLRSEEIDTALVVRLNENNPFAEPNILLSKGVDEIKAATGSKYLPVPLNRIITQIITREDIKRVGIVGLPCHIEGFKKAGTFFKKLDSKIAFTIGLFCRQTKELGFTKVLLSRLGLESSQVASFSYRGSGWPGYVGARLKDGGERKCLFFDEGFLFLWLLQSFMPLPCMLCCDPTSEFADISLGDAWLKEFADDEEGVSLIVTRTQKGDMLIREAEEQSIISIRVISPEKVVKSQIKRAVMRKKVNYRSKLAAFRPSGYKQISKYFNQKLDLRGFLALRQVIMARNISSGKLFTYLFSNIPTAFFDWLKRGAQRRGPTRTRS